MTKQISSITLINRSNKEDGFRLSVTLATLLQIRQIKHIVISQLLSTFALYH